MRSEGRDSERRDQKGEGRGRGEGGVVWEGIEDFRKEKRLLSKELKERDEKGRGGSVGERGGEEHEISRSKVRCDGTTITNGLN